MPVTSPDIRGNRLRWARVVRAWNVDNNWSKVVFSDESKFKLNVHDGNIRVWRPNGRANDPEFTVQRGGAFAAGIMFWGCIGFHGVGELVAFDVTVNAQAYVDTLQGNLRQSIENIFGDRNHPFVFQHDNAPVHSARLTSEWLDTEDITVMRWPPYSPDMNIIEHLWNLVLRKLRQNPPGNLAELRRRVFRHWGEITPAEVQTLYRSLPRRVQELIRVRGYPTRY